METGLGGEVSIELGALIVTVASSIILLSIFLILGENLWLSIFEVVVGGLIMGSMYYLGLRLRS